MTLSMRALIAADHSLPSDLRDAVARGGHDSTRQLMSFGLDACEAAELMDTPCDDLDGFESLDGLCGCGG